MGAVRANVHDWLASDRSKRAKIARKLDCSAWHPSFHTVCRVFASPILGFFTREISTGYVSQKSRAHEKTFAGSFATSFGVDRTRAPPKIVQFTDK
jgi:hypothetical protein